MQNPSLRSRTDLQCDLCVKCGMCLNVCPTYRLARRETESPRGRIAMIQALERGEIQPTPGLATHLDQCLQCRACEAVCPSGVPYGEIIHQGQQHIGKVKTRNASLKAFWYLFNHLLKRRGGATLISRLLWFYRKAGMQTPGTVESRDAHISAAGQGQSGSSETIFGSPAVTASRVQLFTGCMSQSLQPEVVTAAIRVLQRLGFEADLIDDQCCGALHEREGELTRAGELKSACQKALRKDLPVISLVSACTTTLREETADTPVDFASFVLRRWPDGLVLAPLEKTVAVHESCSLRNGLREHELLYRLLQKIPQARILPLAENEFCCGAAGTHMLAHPDQASLYRQPKLDSLQQLQADILITTSLGCAMHFQAGLGRDSKVQVLHPAQLLAGLL